MKGKKIALGLLLGSVLFGQIAAVVGVLDGGGSIAGVLGVSVPFLLIYAFLIWLIWGDGTEWDGWE